MNGTVHTCVGQEFSAVAVAGQLGHEDWVTSNHRCHGHFISKTGNWPGLIDELMGFKSGVCKGVGSSQHLYAQGFLSNGPQAALVPVGLGIALHKKQSQQPGIVVSYIGEGTLGEGVIYESMNLAALYQVPQLIVCENNLYSQSTPQDLGVSGDILTRAEAFGIKVFESDTWNPEKLIAIAREAIDYVRDGRPAFFLIRTYRLNPHSKGDDNRDPEEVAFFREHDPLNKILETSEWRKVAYELELEISEHIKRVAEIELRGEEYVIDQLPRAVSARIRPVENPKIRMVQALNQAYRTTLENGGFHIGEDIEDPYGGAFKVTKGLSSDFPGMVRNTSISENALVGIAIGMSLMGTKSYAEIMFGDFMTHTFDQLISNASKMHHMYAMQVSVPVRVRTPMGGKRGYGPTHSQSLEKHFLGIDNVAVVALSSLVDPGEVISEVDEFSCPFVLVENKVDYGRYLWQADDRFYIEREMRSLGSVRVRPRLARPTLTIVSYGETARHLADNLETIFIETDHVPELVCMVQLHPIDINLIERSVKETRKILVVEDGSTDFGIGAEVVSRLVENGVQLDWVQRIGAEPVPIPSVANLETEFLPTIERVFLKLKLS